MTTVKRLRIHYGLIGVLASTAMFAVLANAADAPAATAAFSEMAEKFGLWATLSVVLVIASIIALYKQSVFVQTKLVDLIEDNQRCLIVVGKALEHAPCGKRMTQESLQRAETAIDWRQEKQDRE